MANSLYKVHELMVKAGVELEEVDRKHIESIAEKAGDLLSKGMVKAAGASFDEIGDILNKKLREAGKEPLVFTNIQIDNKTLDNMVSMFADRISSGVADSIKDGIKEGFKSAKGAVPPIDLGMDEQLKKLKADRQKLIGEYEKTQKLIKNKTRMHQIADFDPISPEHKKMTLEGDVLAHARGTLQKYKDAVEKFKNTSKESTEYADVVLDAQEAYNDILHMREVLVNTQKRAYKKGKTFDIPKELRSPYNLTNRTSTEIIDSDVSHEIMQAFEGLHDIFDSTTAKLDEIKSDIDDINNKINALENNDGILKSLTEIDKAYERILKKKERAKEKSGKERLESAIKYDGSESLTTIGNRYKASNLAGENWEEQYIWLVKFVKEYQNILDFNKTADKNHKKKISPVHTELYNKLLPMYADAEKSLNDLWAKVSSAQSGDVAKQNAVSNDAVINASEEEVKAKNDVIKATEEEAKIRMAIVKELAKHGTFEEAHKAGGKKIEYEGQEVSFGKFVGDYFKNYLGQSFSREGYEKLWKEARAEFAPKFEPVEITKEDAIEVIREKVPDNILDGWFRDGNTEYKAKLEQLAMSDDDIRNAALNIMWSNFKEFSGKDIGFAEFLQSEISMYRGKNQENYVAGDETIAFTFDKKVAEGFGKYVLETLVKPIETIGAYQTTGESEALVYRDKLEGRPEYQQWHAEMKGIANETDSVAEEQEQVRKEAEAIAKAEKDAADEIERQKRSLDKIGDTYKKNILPGVTKEISAQLDSQTGDFNRLVIGDASQVEDHNNFATDYDSFTGKYKEHYDTDYHTHPTDVAAPSMSDLARYRQSSDHGYQDRAVIQAMKEALFLDFSSLSSTAMKEMISEYGAKSERIKGEFLAKYGEDRDPTSENNQKLAIELKNAFLEVVQKYPGVATYVDHEMPRYDSVYDRYKELPSEIQEVVKELAKLDKVNEEAKDWDAIDAKEQQLASLDPGLGRIIGSEEYLEMLDKISVSTDTYNDATKSIQEETAAQEELNQKKKEAADIPVPSEDDIKSGKASWRGMPIKYNASLPNEAQNLTDFMEVGPKFFESQNQDGILDHEVAHNIADRLMKYAAGEWEKATDIFISNGEGLYGDLGASALSETLAHAVTEYFDNPDALKSRSEGAFNYIEEYLKKSGDTLDNVYSKRGESPIGLQSDNVVSDNEKKIKSYEELKGVLQEYHDAIVNIKNAEGEQKQPHVEKYMDLNNLLLEQLEDDDQRSQLMSKLKDVSSAGVDEESVKSIAQMFGIDIPQAVEKAENSVDALKDKLEKIKEFRKLMSTSYMSADDPLYSDAEKEIERLTRIKELYSEITGETDDWSANSTISWLDRAIREAEKVADTLRNWRHDLEAGYGDEMRDIRWDDAYTDVESSQEYQWMFSDAIDGKIPYEDELEEQIDKITHAIQRETDAQEQLNAANQKEKKVEQSDGAQNVVADNQKKIESYEKLCELVERYRALQKVRSSTESPISPELKGLADTLFGSGLKFDEVMNNDLDDLARKLGVEIPQAISTSKQEIDELTASLEKQKQVESTDNSPAEVAETNAETDAIERKTDALEEQINTQRTLKDMVEHANQHGVPGQSVADAAGVTGGADTTVGANMQELQNVLDAITYKVKIVNDDTDKTANKIALDDSTLDETLNRVFANILNPVTEQNDGNAQEPWAREDTLQTVKGVLDAIQANTAKIGTSEVATVADDGVLSAIKKAVESINKKIVQGTKVIKTGDNKRAEEKSGRPEIKNAEKDGYKNPHKVDKRVKDLQTLYAEQGTLEVQGDYEPAKIRLAQIEQDILDIKKQGIALDEEEIANIKEKAKRNEENRLAVERAEDEAKQKVKDEKAALRAEMKNIRDKSRLAKADSTWRSGKDVHGLTMNMVDESQGISIDDVINHPDVQGLYNELDNLTLIREKVNNQISTHKEVSEEDAIALQKQTAATQQQAKVVKELQKNYEFFSGDNSASLGQIYTGEDLESQLKQAIILATNGKAKFHEYNATLGQWTYSVKGANNETKNYTGGLRGLDNQLRTVHTSTKKTESMFDGIKRKVKEVFTYFSGSSIIYKIFGLIRQGIQYIREIDKAMTELRKVTNETEETYDKFLKTAAKTAGELGSTISQVVEATATFAKLGYSMEMASEMAEAALVYKNVGDGIASAEDAADSIISTLKGFRLEASESMRIVDRFNEIGNKFAITSKGIGDALRVSASALSAAGNTLDESIGLITAANEVVNDPSSVGTALKTLTLRLRGSKTELEEMGEDVSDMATTTSQLQAKLLALTGGKVDIMLDANTFKSSTQILREMAAAWENMTDIQRAEWCPYVQKCA